MGCFFKREPSVTLRQPYRSGKEDMASHWDPEAYLTYHLWVAEKDGAVVGFAVHRSLDEQEMELLNVAVDPAHRREGVATRLIGNIDSPNLLLEVKTE